jgi:hypothetical protein
MHAITHGLGMPTWSEGVRRLQGPTSKWIPTPKAEVEASGDTLDAEGEKHAEVKRTRELEGRRNATQTRNANQGKEFHLQPCHAMQKWQAAGEYPPPLSTVTSCSPRRWLTGVVAGPGQGEDGRARVGEAIPNLPLFS